MAGDRRRSSTVRDARGPRQAAAARTPHSPVFWYKVQVSTLHGCKGALRDEPQAPEGVSPHPLTPGARAEGLRQPPPAPRRGTELRGSVFPPSAGPCTLPCRCSRAPRGGRGPSAPRRRRRARSLPPRSPHRSALSGRARAAPSAEALPPG